MITLPASVTKYFWGDDLSELSWTDHQQYIIQTVLEKGDAPAVNWLLKKIPRESLANSLNQYKLSPKSANFWKVYLS